jgi:signal peptidase I
VRDFTKGALKFLGVVLAIALIAGGVLYGFFVKIVEVGHNAMAPTMILGDRVLVWKTTELELGDIALCAHPQEPGRYVMGRVVGRTGQTITFERGQLQINGETPDSQTLQDLEFDDAETGRRQRMRLGRENILDRTHWTFRRTTSEPRMRRPHRVGPGLFLLSDNRTHLGEDSRAYGEVTPSTCVGRVFMRLTAAPSPSEVGNAALDRIQ